MTHLHAAKPRLIIAATGLCLVVGLPGCGSGSGGGNAEGPTRVLTAADFANATPAEPAPARPMPIPVVTEAEAREGISDVVVIDGSPATAATPTAAPASAASATGTPSVGSLSLASAAPTATPTPTPLGSPTPTGGRLLSVDRSVGQINGRPIYASAFLEDMDDRLRRNAQRMKRPEWVKETFKLVGEKLRDEMRDELLLSEFNTGLKPEQKPGIAAFLTKVEEDLRSGNLGSETLANKRLLEEEGKTIQEKARDIGDKAFIQDQLRRTVYNRVQVNAGEVRRYYENNPNEFKEPGVATFVIIQAPRSETERVARIESALAAGEPFMDVAERESDWRRAAKEDRFILDVKFTKSYGESDFFGPAPLNTAARALAPGGRTQRIDAGASAWWVMLESAAPSRDIPFYEAQLGIEKKIRNERYREVETAYFNTLLRRSSATSLEEMALKLTEFADQRYWGEGRVTQPAAATPASAPAQNPDRQGGAGTSAP
ncbi:MAG: peptidyl-prolyl cis-trans isomerase [Phycisphaerales bacterium]